MNVEEMFRKSGAVLEGHFLLHSGMHSPVYWEKFKVLQYPEYVTPLCGMIADHFRSYPIDLVAGPVTGGIILAFEVARQLKKRAIYAENEGDRKTFRRGAVINPGDRILIVDDVMTAGGSINDVIDAVNKRQGKIIGVGVLVDRSDKSPDFGVPLFSCLRTMAIAYSPDKCPQCATKIPLVKMGGGK
jgi:orotate phosphoribosyltransferase